MKEERLAIAAQEQADAAESADRPDADGFEGEVLHLITLNEGQSLRRQTDPVEFEGASSVEIVSRIGVWIEMENRRRLVGELWLVTSYEVWVIVVLLETALPRFADDCSEIALQLAIPDHLEFLFEINLAVPNFQRRKAREGDHALAIRRDGRRRQRPSALLRQVCILGRNGDACRQTFEINCEIDAGQRFVEIIDVKEYVIFGRTECAKIHQMTVAAGLHRSACGRLLREIARHYRRRAAQKRERVLRHPLVALG